MPILFCRARFMKRMKEPPPQPRAASFAFKKLSTRRGKRKWIGKYCLRLLVDWVKGNISIILKMPWTCLTNCVSHLKAGRRIITALRTTKLIKIWECSGHALNWIIRERRVYSRKVNRSEEHTSEL